MRVVPSILYQFMKFPSLDGRGIMKLHGGQIEYVKECFTVTESTSVMPLQKKTLKDKPEPSTGKAIVTKEIKIGSNEEPKMTTVGFPLKRPLI